MNQMKYTTDEYVTDHDIRQFIEGLQLSFFVKECSKINDYILALMRNPLPAPNRTIVVTGQGEAPQGLEGVKGVFNILIAYYSHENPQEKEESTIVKKRLGHHGVSAVYTRRKYGTDVRIQINLNEFEPSVVTANEKREAAKKNTAIDPYIETNDTGFFQLFVDSLLNQPQKETKMNLEQIATELTEMGVTDFWAGMLMHLANEAGYSGEHDVKFEKLSDSIAVSFGECQGEMDTQRVVIEALNQDLSINTYTDGAIFLVPVTVLTLKKPTQQTKTQKETKMSNEQTPTDTDLIWKKFREQLEAAKLSEQSIGLIMRTLRDDTGLKKPTTESVLLCTKSRNVTNVFYSHTGKPVTLTDAEDTYAFEDGETLSYGAGHRDAFFIADTTNVKTFEEKMIYRHVGVPKITLNLSNGKSIELPFKKEYLKVTEDAVVIHLNSDVSVSLSNKDLNSLTGWALTDLNEVENSRFFVNGTEYTLEEYNRKRELWKKQGIINPGAGSWSDIEKS